MNTDTEVVVIGGINVDIKSRVDAPLVMATSNPGTTTVTAGGVGRNIAESLARLGVRTSLISAVGDDAIAADRRLRADKLRAQFNLRSVFLRH